MAILRTDARNPMLLKPSREHSGVIYFCRYRRQLSVKAEAPCPADKQEQETAQYRQVLIETRILCPADG